MKAAIVSIGDELLIGQVVNTNASFIAERLNRAGLEVSRIVTVADELEDILIALREEYARNEVVIVTGGLGPTHDDVTRSAICTFFQTELTPNPLARAAIEEYLKSRNAPWTEAAENQTLFPLGATVIPNRHGTAPGELFMRDGKHLIVMPGVPSEMEAMVDDVILPHFLSLDTGNVVLHRTLKTTGIPESVLAERLGEISAITKGGRLAFLPSYGGVRLRITVVGNDRARAIETVRAIESRIRAKAEKFIYGVDDEELEEVLGRELSARKLTISVAESCTGGMITSKLTDVPGSSAYLERGVVVYSDRSKEELLGVQGTLIATAGAVSREVAEAMAAGIRERSGTAIGVSTTGIAGPSGGTPGKPVGLVWIGYADVQSTFAVKFTFGPGRRRVKERASQAALEIVRRRVLKID